MSDWNTSIIEEFRANGGKVGGPFEGAALVLLTTTGARTGRPHTTPAMYVRDGARILVSASNAGADRHPAWFHNLVANPRVTVEIGHGGDIETYTAVADVLEGRERDLMYARFCEMAARFAEYQAKTDRVIPVVALYRVDPGRAQAIGDHLVRVHDKLRREMADLLAEVDAHLADPAGDPVENLAGRARPAFTDQLRDRCVDVCHALHGHHDKEVARAFPLLEQRFPGITPALEQFHREHKALNEIRLRVQEALARLGTTDPATVRSELEQLSAEMNAHFDREERRLVAALNAL